MSEYILQSESLFWTDQDMNVLAQHAAVWGYRWMGQIVLAR